MEAGKEPVDLYIELRDSDNVLRGKRKGWRICQDEGGRFDKTPEIKEGTTVRWHSEKAEAYLVFFEKSPVTVHSTVVHIPKNGIKEFTVADYDSAEKKIEYAALVKEGDDYTYVRGAASPPGVIVKPPGGGG